MVKEDFTDEMFEDGSDGLTLDDLSSGFISNPPVGESINITVKKIIKLTGTNLVGKKTDGTTFKKNLSNVDYGYEITTTNGDRYTVSSWEVFGKVKNIFQKLKLIDGVELQIKHLLDGMKPENKKKDKYTVAAKVDGKYMVLDRETRQWS